MSFDLATAKVVGSGARENLHRAQMMQESGGDPAAFDITTAKPAVKSSDTQTYFRQETGKTVSADLGLQGKELEYLDDTQNNGKKHEDFFGFTDLKQKTLDILEYPAALAKGAGYSAVHSYATLVGGLKRQIGEAQKEVFENKPLSEMDYKEKIDAISRANTPALATMLFGSVRDRTLQTGWINRLLTPKEEGIKSAERLIVSSAKIQNDANKLIKDMNFEREDGAKGFIFDIGSVTTTIGASIGLSVATKNPVAAAALFGDLQKNSIYLEAKENGFENMDADKTSGLAGMLEGGLEFVGVSYFLKAAEMSKPIQRIGFRMFEEAMQEGSQTVAEETLTQSAGLRPKDIEGGIARTFYSMLLGSIGGGGVAVVTEVGKAKAKEEGVPEHLIEPVAKKMEEAMPEIEKELVQIVQDQTSPLTENSENTAKAQKIIGDFIQGKDIDISELGEEEQAMLEKVGLQTEKKSAKAETRIAETRIADLEKQSQKLTEVVNATEDPTVIRALNREINKINNELDSLIVEQNKVGRNKLVGKAGEIRSLNSSKNAMRIVKQSFRKANVATKRDVKGIQENLIKALDDSGLEAEDKAKFIHQIKNIQTAKQLNKKSPEIEARVMELLEAQQRRGTISSIRKIVKKVRKSNVIAVDFAKQIESLFNEIDTKKRRPETLEKLQKTLDFMKENPEAKMPRDVLKKLDVLNKKRLEDISTEELEGIHEELGNLVKQGKTKLQLLEAKKERLKTERLAELQDSVPLSDIEVKRAPIGERLSIMDRIKNKYIETRNRLGRIGAATNPMDVFFDMLDGNKSYKGSNHKIFKQTIDKAFTRYLNLKEEASRDVKNLTDKLGLNEKNYEKIGAYAVLQQEGGLEKLLETGITQEEIDALQLTEPEMQAYTLMREKLDAMLPAIKEVMRVVYNKDVDAVKDYFPFLTDHDAMKDFEIQDMVGDGLPTIGKKKNVEKGFTVSRTGGRQKIRIDALGVFLKHVDNAAYLVEMGGDIKALGDVATAKEYGEAVGDIGQEMVVEWIGLLARKGNSQNRVEAIDVFRRNTGFAVLGFKLSSIFIQPTALMDGAALVGGGYVARGVTQVTNPEWRKFLKENIPEIRERGGDDPAYIDLGGNGIVGNVREAGFWALKNVDLMTASAVAAGAYTKSVEDRGGEVDLSNPDPVAIQEAQLMMRRTQSSVFAKDSPAILTQGSLTGNVSVDKLIFQFQSFMLNRWSLIKHDMWNAGIREGKTAQALNIATWLLLANAAEVGIRRLSKELIGLLTGDEPKDWEETIDKEAVITLLGNVPFVSAGVNSLEYGSSPIPALSVAAQITDQLKWAALSKDPDKKARHLTDAAMIGVGVALGVPGTIQAESIFDKSLKEKKGGKKSAKRKPL